MLKLSFWLPVKSVDMGHLDSAGRLQSESLWAAHMAVRVNPFQLETFSRICQVLLTGTMQLYEAQCSEPDP